jgi:RHS repeat-associated protein
MLAIRAKPHRIKAAHRRRRRVASRVWLPGQYYDAETGLNYNYFRDYEPGTGRYVESDPARLKGGINLYGYVRQDPLRSADHLGLSDQCVFGFCYGSDIPLIPSPPQLCTLVLKETCREGCRKEYKKELEDFSKQVVDDESCENLANDPMPEKKDMCEQMQAASYQIMVIYLQRKLSKCLASCEKCSCSK